MTFVHSLLSFLSGAFNWLGDAFGKLFQLLSVPFGWLLWLFDGIWYFLFSLFKIVVAVLHIFVSLFQFLGAIILGFLRTIKGFLFIDFNQTPVHYPSSSFTGLKLVADFLQPIGFMTVFPMVLLAVLWLLFVLRVFALLGDGDVDA
ncbi:hypothetical protein [Paenibacillus sp. FSL R7-0128]|uniref:hypothetical protein n=1 Tax=Paenibacillus sp. FSL R7-0128 TaxID=2954529 RepID=UPI0030F689E1